METFLMVSEVARLLGKSEQTVRVYERRGRLPAIRTNGGRRLFKEGDVRKLAAQLSKAEEQPAR